MHPSSDMQLRHEGGVMANPGLSVWPGSPGLARPWLFEPLLTDVLWAAWLVN
jgi:hypothetical protein